ncbi:nuclear intron maturase 4, mitochondrial isoform X2 [Cryptomeria japonica]|nr:nuclear intron maturase 4, mitochondrial isoform X2 [Cryptomeria japonica]
MKQHTNSKRRLELYVKMHVKQQHNAGKFRDLLANVIANPEVLQVAYESIRLGSNLMTSDISEFSTVSDSNDNSICVDSIAQQLVDGDFDVKSNTRELFLSTHKQKPLVLPNLKLKVVQEAIRMALEVVYKPQFSKISHSCRSGRGQHSALKYIQNQIRNPDWWFNISIQKKLDTPIFMKLVATMKERIEDDNMYNLLGQMFEANVLNVEFGGFPKGQGCPQEGILSSVLMNIYLDLFDQEYYKMSLHYEALDHRSDCECKMNSLNQTQHSSKLRQWLRNKMKQQSEGTIPASENRRLHACRYMDEIFVAISGPKELAIELKDGIIRFLENILNLEMESTKTIVHSAASEGIRFLGMDIQSVPLSELQSSKKESFRLVHKLSSKIDQFSQQMDWHWEAWTKRLGKKWLSHALKKIKEADAGKPGETEDLSECRKPGMKLDHWFQEMLIIWIQDLDKQFQKDGQRNLWLRKVSGEDLLSELIIKSELPQDLCESYCLFQQKVKEYLTSESITMNTMKESLENSKHETDNSKFLKEMRIVVNAPVSSIINNLIHLGLLDRKRNPQRLRALIPEEDLLIIHWYTGLAKRWINYFYCCRNFSVVQDIISENLISSCILTLSAKHKISYTKIQNRFSEELCAIPSREETETGTPFEPDTSDRTSFGNSLWLLTVNKSSCQSARCSIACCSSKATKMYFLHKNKQEYNSSLEDRKSPTGFNSLHPSFERKCIPMCTEHVKDLYLGKITLQNIDFTIAPFSKPS